MSTKPFVGRFIGKNSQIPLFFFEIINFLPLFEKYTILKKKKKVHLELKFIELEFLVILNWLPVFQTFELFGYLFHYLFTIVNSSLIPRDPNKRKKKVKPTPGSQWENWKNKKQNWKSKFVAVRNKTGSQQLWRQWEYWKNKKKNWNKIV